MRRQSATSLKKNKRKEEHAAKRDLVEDKGGDTEGQVFTDPTKYHIEEKGF